MSKVVKKLKYKVSDTELSDDIYFKVNNGEGLDYVDNKLKVKPATQSALGGVKPDGTSITIDLDGTIHSGAGSLEAGEGISIIDNKINTKVDGQTVFFNQQGQLSSTGGGGGGVGSLTRDLIVNQLNGVLFDKTDLGSNIYEIETHNDLLLLSKEGSPIQWSANGITWHNGTSINGGYFLRSFDVAGTKYAYMSSRNSAQYSADGKTWTDYNISGVSNYWNMCSSGSSLIQGTDNGVYFSEDGVTWVATDLTTGGYGRYNIAYGNERFVIGGADGIYYSDDGLHWNKGDYTGNQLNGITYGTTGFVAYSGNNSVGYYYSADGQHWEKTNVEEGVSGEVVFGQGYFLGCLSGIGMFYSDDGKNWTQTSVAKNSFVNGADVQTFKFIRGMWIGCGSKGIFYSTDGKNWYQSNITDTTYDVVYFNNSIFVTGDKTKYIYKYTPSSVIDGDNIANATKTEVGVVKPDGTTIDVSQEGTLTALGESGESIINKINLNGNKQIFASKVSKATSFGLGVVRPDNVTTFVNSDGVLSAVGSTPGLVPGQGISIDGDIISLKVDGDTLIIDTETGKLTLANTQTNSKKKLKSFSVNYQGGQGILIQDEMISVNNDERYIGFTEDGALTLVPSNAEPDKGTIMNSVGDYASGNGIVINESNVISVKVDNEYIGFDSNGNLKVIKGLKPTGIVFHQSDISQGNWSTPYCYNGLWVIGSQQNSGIYFSTDGKNWTQSNKKDGYWNAPYCFNGLWVIGYSNTDDITNGRGVYYSTDGINWVQSRITTDFWNTPYCYNGLWVIGCENSSTATNGRGVYHSTDGITWTQSNITLSCWYTPYCYNGLWVIGCQNKSDITEDNGVYHSTDGITWTQSNIKTGHWKTPYYYNGLWVIGCKSMNDIDAYRGVYYSTDGKNWTQSNITSSYWNAPYCYNGLWVIGCSSLVANNYDVESGVYYSTDGKNWTQSNIKTGRWDTPYCYNDLWVIGSYDSAGIYFSIDGKNWKQSNIATGRWNTPYCYNDLWTINGDTDTGIWYGVPTYSNFRGYANNEASLLLQTKQQFNDLFKVNTSSNDISSNLFLTIKNGKITLANQSDEIIGIIQQEESQMSIIGCLTVQDDGTCVVGQKCNVSHDGIATLSEDGYIVLERLEDNLIKIIFK